MLMFLQRDSQFEPGDRVWLRIRHQEGLFPMTVLEKDYDSAARLWLYLLEDSANRTYRVNGVDQWVPETSLRAGK